MSERGETEYKPNSQQQIAINLRAVLGEVGTPEIPFQRRIVKLEPRKAALELGCVRRSRRRQAASLKGIDRLCRGQFASCCLRRSRASLMKRRHTS
jgi:hypothetical protein